MLYYFNFQQSIGLRQIDEPFGADKVPFGIMQESGRKGRDVNYAGGSEAKYTITTAVDRYGFEFDQFLKDWLRYGFELQIELQIDFGNGIEVVGNIAKVSTNQYDTIEFIVVQKLAEARLKRNYEVTQDLFAGDNPVSKYKVLVPAKPTIQVSEWKLAPFQYTTTPSSNPNEYAIQDNSIYFNPLQQQVKTDIKASLTWTYNVGGDPNGFRLLTLGTNASGIKIEFFTNILYKYRPNEAIVGLDKAGSLGLFVAYGQTYETATILPPVWYNGSVFEVDQDFQLPTYMQVEIPYLTQTDSVWIYWRVGSQNGAVNRIQFDINDRIQISLTSTALTTVVPCIRYIDAIRKVVGDASGLSVISPRFDFGGEMYDQFITNPSLMRNIEDKPFYLSFKDIIEERIRPEVNGDYEIDANSNVFIGFYRDFYRNFEIGAFEQVALKEFRLEEDERKAIKIIKNGFKSFASQKETEEGNTFDIVHGTAEHKTENENASGTREALVGDIRDAFLISQIQIKSYNVSKTSATQDDNKVIALDVVPLPSGRTETYTFTLQHIWAPELQRIILRNDGSFNWINLGVYVGSSFQILTGLNANTYIVGEVTATDVSLVSDGGNNLIENTTVKYGIDPTVTLKARTNEGFIVIENIAQGDNFINLPFTTKRILETYFNEEIASYCLPIQSQVINTEYNNNPDALTQFTGQQEIKEGETFTPTGAILEPVIIRTQLAMTLQEYWDMAQLLRSERGFIRTWDANNMPIKGYIREGEYIPPQYPSERQGYFECTLEKKYEPFYLDILAVDDTFIINGQVQPTGFRFSIDDTGYVSFKDSTGKLLFYPVPYDRVKINNSGATSSVQELGMWLSQYAIS